MIDIRLANREDIPRIMQFIDEHWKKGHIMATNRTLFEFQHVENDKVYYVIAEDTDTKKVYGTMGYIPMNHAEYPAISTMMIRALPHEEYDMLGEDMMRYFENNISCGNVISPGIKKRYALAVDGIESGHVGTLRHYYRLRDLKEYRVAHIVHKELSEAYGSGSLWEVKDSAELRNIISQETLIRNYPYRDYEYIIHRYFEHPFYPYHCYQINHDGPAEAILIARENEANGTKVLRVVDYFGDDDNLIGIGNALDELMEQNEYEYIDFYCYGIDDDIMKKAGFMERIKDDSNIIPNYFEPFLQTNQEIYFYAWYMEGLHVYRGFGDQDRPNHIN